MKLICRIAVTIALVSASAAVTAESRLHTALTTIADEEGGRGRDYDLILALSPSWSLDAGVGSVNTQLDEADIDGTSVRAGVGVRSERFGLRGYYRNYSDSSNFESETIGARASIDHGLFTWSLIAEARGFELEYTSGSAGAARRSTADIDVKGFGAGLSYVANGWGAHAEALFYDSRSQLDEYDFSASRPTLLGIPLAHQLASSAVTFKQGVLDHQLAAGLERGFDRSSFRFDWTGVEDAISGAKSSNFSAGYKYALTANANIGITLGVTNSELDSVNFAGASFVLSL